MNKDKDRDRDSRIKDISDIVEETLAKTNSIINNCKTKKKQIEMRKSLQMLIRQNLKEELFIEILRYSKSRKIHEFFIDEHYQYLEELGVNEHVGEDLLDELARHWHYHVRTAVAKNRNVSNRTLEFLVRQRKSSDAKEIAKTVLRRREISQIETKTN